VPAGGEAEIGGDYFDLFCADGGSVVVAIGDVCGKGITAATKTSMIKYSVRAFVRAGLGPAGVLDEVNRMVAEAGDPSDIVTLWVGFVHAGDGSIVWANGGHPPALLLSSDKRRIDRLGTTGPLLGAIPGVAFEEERMSVSVGDTLLLYTDGVTEARNGNRFFGEGRVQRSLRYGGAAPDVTERLLGSLRRFVAEPFRDDVAIVALRFRDAGDETDSEDGRHVGHESDRT
jgi:sigma-B regulation protein RsbU (phosphoserine phosphatase)